MRTSCDLAHGWLWTALALSCTFTFVMMTGCVQSAVSENDVGGTNGAEATQPAASYSSDDRLDQPSEGRVPVGQTVRLANDPDSRKRDVMWDGAMDVTVNSAALYELPAIASEKEDIGSIISTISPYETNGGILVVHMTFHNIDAESRLVRAGASEGKYVFFSSLFQPKALVGDEVVIVGSPYAFGSSPQEASESISGTGNFTLEPGESITCTMSYWIDGGVNLSDIVISPASYGMGGVVFDLGLVPSPSEDG